MRSKKHIALAERGIHFSTPLATQKARLTSEAGMDAPCDEEMEFVFDEVASAFGGTFNDFTDSSGTLRCDWQFHLPDGITIERGEP